MDGEVEAAGNGAAAAAALEAPWRDVGADTLRIMAEEVGDMLKEMRVGGGNARAALPYGLPEAAASAGVSTQAFRRAAMELGVWEGRGFGRIGLPEMNRVRDRLGVRRSRGEAAPVRIAVQSYKGGVGKTTLALLLAQYMAREGYRVLMVDCDPQATATSGFGYVPDIEFRERDTVVPYAVGREESLAYAVRPTGIEGLDLVPSCLALQTLDITLFRMQETAGGSAELMYGMLDRAIGSVEEAYDAVVVDSAPSLSMMSAAVMAAASGLVVPVPPTVYDLASTEQYLHNVADMSEAIGIEGFEFVRVVPSRVDRTKRRQMDVLDLMRGRLGRFLTASAMSSAGTIQERAERGETLLTGSERPDSRVLAWAVEVLEELVRDVERCWEADRVDG